jgi:hypothetical protein
MKRRHTTCTAFFALTIVLTGMLSLWAQDAPPAATVPVHMLVTLNPEGAKPIPEVKREDVFVKQGKERLKVTEWFPTTGERAALDLFILIDDACDTSLGSQLNDLRSFISAQPSTTSVGVGYMRNATVQITQNFTNDHDLAAKALRLPLGTSGSYGSPYLSLIDLLKRWPEHPVRREVVMVTDGIDRARGGGPRSFPSASNPDVDSAVSVALRTGTIIYTIYSPGVGRVHRNFWEANNGQNFISQLSEATGGESFYLGLQAPVSFQPYLNDMQRMLNNQYLLGFLAKPKKKAGLQYVKVSSEITGVEIVAPDAVWVPATK